MVEITRTIFTLGKGPVSSYNNKAKIWVVNMTAKQQATLDFSKKLVRSGLLEEIQLFSTYSDVQVKVKSNNRLISGNNETSFQLSNSNPSIFNPSQVFQKLRIPVVKMSELEDSKKYSATTSKGYYLAWDIRCIKKCTITKSFTSKQEVDGWKYQLGFISITDYTTDGYTTDKGLEIPSKLECWVYPAFAEYPKGTYGDAYGCLRLSRKDENSVEEIKFDLCYFDVIEEGPEEDPIPYKSKKQRLKSPQSERNPLKRGVGKRGR